MRIIFTGHGQHRLKRTIDFRVSRSKQLHLIAAFDQALAEIKNNPLSSPMSLRWDRKIDARDLCDFHFCLLVNLDSRRSNSSKWLARRNDVTAAMCNELR